MEQFTCNSDEFGIFIPSMLIIFAFSLLIFYFLGCYKIDERPLYKQKIFWVSSLSPFYWFLTLGFTVWNGCSLSFNAQGYRNFLEISTLPLSILAFTIPVAVFIGHLHRTVQTAVQINRTEYANQLSSDKHLIETIANKIYRIQKSIESLNSTFFDDLSNKLLTLGLPEELNKKFKTALLNGTFYANLSPYIGTKEHQMFFQKERKSFKQQNEIWIIILSSFSQHIHRLGVFENMLKSCDKDILNHKEIVSRSSNELGDLVQDAYSSLLREERLFEYLCDTLFIFINVEDIKALSKEFDFSKLYGKPEALIKKAEQFKEKGESIHCV